MTMLAYLTRDDWQEFYRTFRGAEFWLLMRSLHRELQQLEEIQHPTPWMAERRDALRRWKKAIDDQMTREMSCSI